MVKTSNYRPRASQLMRIYERNYRLLMPLFQGIQLVGDKIEYRVCDTVYCFHLLSQTRYTSVVLLEQNGESSLFETGVLPLSIRLYHDAKVAEVCAVPNIGALKPKYEYPNPHMQQQDEKWQLNCFLNDWLRHGLRHGFQR